MEMPNSNIIQKVKTQLQLWRMKILNVLEVSRKLLLQRLKFHYKLTLWRGLGLVRRSLSELKRSRDLLLRSFIMLFSLIAAILVERFIDRSLTPEILSSYLISIGVMTGGTIAIVFTISLFLLQSAANLFSSQFFEVYIHDWKEKAVYFIVILITILFLGAGIYVGSLNVVSEKVASASIFFSLPLIGFIFVLIDWQYKNVRQKISPVEALVFLEKQGKKFLFRLNADAGKMAELLHINNPAVPIETALAATYNHALQPFINDLNRQLENIIEISVRLADKNEIQSCKRGLKSFHSVLSLFLVVRKKTSVVLPSSVSILSVESDSQNFLMNNFERLNQAAESFMKRGRDDLASYIIDIYDSFSYRTRDFVYVGRAYENPIFDQVSGYLNALTQVGEREKNIEVPFQAARVLGKMALRASEQGLQTSLYGIQDNLYRVAIFGIASKQTIIVDRCLEGYVDIIDSILASKKLADVTIQIKKPLEHLRMVTWTMSVMVKARHIPDTFTTSTSLTKGYDQLQIKLAFLVNRFFTIGDVEEKRRYQSNLVTLFDELSRSLRALSEELKEGDSILVNTISRLIFSANKIIIQLLSDKEIKSDFGDVSDELQNRLQWFIHIPYWFAHHAAKFDGSSLNFHALTEVPARTGVRIAKNMPDEELVASCASCLFSIADECLKKNTNRRSYDEPRIIEKACFLGVIALKNGWTKSFLEMRSKILDFERRYFEEYFKDVPPGTDPINHRILGLPHKDEIFLVLLQWRENFDSGSRRGFPLLEDSTDMIEEIVDTSDIDRFLFEVWGKFPSDSDIAEELEGKAVAKHKKGTEAI